VIGVNIADAEIRTHLGMSRLLARRDGDAFFRHSASYRFDLAMRRLIEEVARILGFRAHARGAAARPAPRWRARPETLAFVAFDPRRMAHVGYYEVINFSFVDGSVGN